VLKKQPSHSIIGAAVLSALLAGCGSTPYDLAVRDRQHAQAEQACTSAGFKVGTNQFATCMQDHDLARMDLKPSNTVSPR
jgi:uncharacterized lipoprotein YajG